MKTDKVFFITGTYLAVLIVLLVCWYGPFLIRAKGILEFLIASGLVAILLLQLISFRRGWHG